MDAEAFLKRSWGLTNEKERKRFVREHLAEVDAEALDARLVAELQRSGPELGLLMVAVRVLQAQPREAVLHQLMRMVHARAGTPRMNAELKAQLAALRTRHPTLEQAAARFVPPSTRRTGSALARTPRK
jgi:hypothetical protein